MVANGAGKWNEQLAFAASITGNVEQRDAASWLNGCDRSNLFNPCHSVVCAENNTAPDEFRPIVGIFRQGHPFFEWYQHVPVPQAGSSLNALDASELQDNPPFVLPGALKEHGSWRLLRSLKVDVSQTTKTFGEIGKLFRDHFAAAALRPDNSRNGQKLVRLDLRHVIPCSTDVRVGGSSKAQALRR